MTYKNFVAGQVLGESDLDDYLMEQTAMTFASDAARDSALAGAGAKRNGTLTYQQDTLKYTSYDGTDWWTVGQAAGYQGMITSVGGAYVDQSGSVAFSGLHHYEYTIVNGMCDHWFSYTISGAGSAGTAVHVNLPVNAANDSRIVGYGRIYDASTTFVHTGVWEIMSGFVYRIALIPTAASITNYWGATPSIALANGDTIAGHVRFQVEDAA